MPRPNFEARVSRLMQAVGLLVRRIRAAGASSDELSLTESAVLSRLAKGGPATIADLARSESMRPQSMGTTVAALEQMGLVERNPHPSDGRQMNLHITAKGIALRKRAKDAKVTWLAHAISALDQPDQEALFRAADILKLLANRESSNGQRSTGDKLSSEGKK